MQLGRQIALQQEDTLMKSPIVKRSIVIGGHKTSVSLEDAFWRGLKEIAHAQRTTLSTVVSEIDKARHQANLSSAIRLFVLDRLRHPEARFSGGERERVEADDSVRQSILTHV
jgi:predicted DNA-binding ribbon-helix-helix protein